MIIIEVKFCTYGFLERKVKGACMEKRRGRVHACVVKRFILEYAGIM